MIWNGEYNKLFPIDLQSLNNDFLLGRDLILHPKTTDGLLEENIITKAQYFQTHYVTLFFINN